MQEVTINTEFITLGQFLKLIDAISSGGEAKFFLKEETVYVNGEKEDRRGKKLFENDIIIIDSIGEFVIKLKH